MVEPHAEALQPSPWNWPTHISAPPFRHPPQYSGASTLRDGPLETERGLTGKGDVEAPLSGGMVGLEFETGHVATACDGGRELVS